MDHPLMVEGNKGHSPGSSGFYHVFTWIPHPPGLRVPSEKVGLGPRDLKDMYQIGVTHVPGHAGLPRRDRAIGGRRRRERPGRPVPRTPTIEQVEHGAVDIYPAAAMEQICQEPPFGLLYL